MKRKIRIESSKKHNLGGKTVLNSVAVIDNACISIVSLSFDTENFSSIFYCEKSNRYILR